jgi:hypothetical protein
VPTPQAPLPGIDTFEHTFHDPIPP